MCFVDINVDIFPFKLVYKISMLLFITYFFFFDRFMATPPASPLQSNIQSPTKSRNTRKSTRLRRLTVRALDQPKPTVYVDAATGRGSGPFKEKFHSYLGVVAREKIPIVHNSWKDVPDTLKDLVWNDILVSDFNIEYMLVYLLLKLNGMQFVKHLQNPL